MKFLLKLLIIQVLVLNSCVTQNELPELTSFPQQIVSLNEGTGFFDGGSIFLDFETVDRKKWQVYFNKRLDNRNDPRTYKTVTLSRIVQKEGQIEVIESSMLKPNGEKEIELIKIFEAYLKNETEKNEDLAYWLKGIIEEIQQRHNKSVE